MADNPRLEELRRRVQLDPASIAFAALAEEYRRGGQFEDAIATCRAGLQRHPAYLSARVTLGRALIETGEFDQAREELEHVLRLSPENLAAIRGLAEIPHRRGEVPEAREQHKAALGVAQTDAAATAAHPYGDTQTRVSPSTAQPAAREAAGQDVGQRPTTAAAVLAGLEAFLDSILRARREAGGVSAGNAH
jgi:tetratricopeptide (TPR) repeat protein